MHLTQAQRGGPGGPRVQPVREAPCARRRGARAGGGGGRSRACAARASSRRRRGRRASRDRRRRTGSSARRRTACSGPLAAASSEWRPWGRYPFGFRNKRNKVRTHTSGMEGKRVSWVELYLDLVFVLAVGQLAHLIVEHPEMHSVGSRSGCSSRCGGRGSGSPSSTTATAADDPGQRVLFLAGSVPRAWPPWRSRRRRGRHRCVRAPPGGHADHPGHGQRARRPGTACCSSGSPAATCSPRCCSPCRSRPGAVPLRAVGDRHRLESSAMLNEDREAARRARGERDSPRCSRPTRRRRSTRTTSPSASACS